MDIYPFKKVYPSGRPLVSMAAAAFVFFGGEIPRASSHTLNMHDYNIINELHNGIIYYIDRDKLPYLVYTFFMFIYRWSKYLMKARQDSQDLKKDNNNENSKNKFYSSSETADFVRRSRYKDKINKALKVLRKAELLTIENQKAVIQAGKNARKMADAFWYLDNWHIFTEKNRDTIIQAGQQADLIAKTLLALDKQGLLLDDNSGDKNRAVILQAGQYAELVGKMILSYHADGILTDETRDATVQTIKDEAAHAKETLMRLFKGSFDSGKANPLELAEACITFKPFAKDFLSTLNDDQRFQFIKKLLLEASERDKYKQLFKDIVKIDPNLVNQMNSRGLFPLFYAINEPNFMAVKLLMECHANPYQTWHLYNPMTYAKHKYKISNPNYLKQLSAIMALADSEREVRAENSQAIFLNLSKILGYALNEKGICRGYALPSG